MAKMQKFVQGVYQNPTKFLVDGQDRDIKPNFGNTIIQGTPYSPTIFNEITRQITYTVKDTSTSANSFIAALDGLEASDLTENLKVIMSPNTTNTGACTLNLQGLGVLPLKKQGNVDLQAGDIVKNQQLIITYNETYKCFEIINPQYDAKIGNLNQLQTNHKATLVGAINENKGNIDTNKSNIGNLKSLKTDDKSSLVAAINEVNSKPTTLVKIVDPTFNDKNYNEGQIWYNKINGNLFIFKGLDEDNLGTWSIYNEDGEVSRTKIYGFEVDENNLNPATAVTYIGYNQNYTPAKVVNGVINWGSWEAFIRDISYRCLVKSGVEQYKVQYDNPSKKLDGSSAILTGTDGDVFTKFKHIWRKYTKTTKGYKIELSDKPFTGAKSLVTELENGYNQFNNPVMILLQDLYLLLFKDRDSQTALGRGYVNSNDNHINTGGTNSKGFIYGETTGKLQMCFLGIEDLWGNKLQWVDGLVSDSSYNILIGTKSFNDAGTGYSKFTTEVTENLYGYAKTVQGGDAGYVLADKAGSTSTGYCDYGDLNSGEVAAFGGYRSTGDVAGVFCVRLYYTASIPYPYIGARLCFKNTEGVYVGNYLGCVEGTKLRSISGKEPTRDKTIGSFRTYAKNNN